MRNGDHRAGGEGKTGRLAENRIGDGWQLTARPADFPDLGLAVEACTSRVRKWQKSAGSPNLIELTFRTPRHGIGDPAVDIGFPPASAVDADPDLGRERTLGDLSVYGGPGQAGPAENGFQADDTVWFGHGCAASCRLFLTAPDPDRTSIFSRARGFEAP